MGMQYKVKWALGLGEGVSRKFSTGKIVIFNKLTAASFFLLFPNLLHPIFLGCHFYILLISKKALEPLIKIYKTTLCCNPSPFSNRCSKTTSKQSSTNTTQIAAAPSTSTRWPSSSMISSRHFKYQLLSLRLNLCRLSSLSMPIVMAQSIRKSCLLLLRKCSTSISLFS